MRKLNPLLKLAAISGVETAIKLHIERGDDLDARDSSGATPLILAATRSRKGVVHLLLDAGANPTLTDKNGMDALACAVRSGCPETIVLLTEALGRFAAPEPSKKSAVEIFNPCIEEWVIDDTYEPREQPLTSAELVSADTLHGQGQLALLKIATKDNAGKQLAGADEDSIVGLEQASTDGTIKNELAVDANVMVLDEEPLRNLHLGDWEVEDEVAVPQGDITVGEKAKQVHLAIRRHKLIDRDEDWGDVDLYLPAKASPLSLDEKTVPLRNLLLTALRVGMVSERALIDICSSSDGSRNEEAENHLAFVAEELGATIVEWTGLDEPFRGDPTLEEERFVTEAIEFAEELASGKNDPFRFYVKGIPRDLLDADEEIALGREMEVAGQAAVSALAVWQEGLSTVFEAAARVARGEADSKSYCSGAQSLDDDVMSQPLAEPDDCDDGDTLELDNERSFFVNAVAAVEAVRNDPQKAAKALSEVRLTRSFLMELAENIRCDGAGSGFLEALNHQAVARDRMILSNLRLALSIAKKYLWSGIPFDDLVQEANIGLMMAVERYDWRRGLRFSTYATWWIRQRVTRSIADTARVVRAPVHIQEKARKVLRERELFEAQLGRPETELETARRVGMTLSKTRMLMSMFDDVISLDEIDSNTGLPFLDELVDPNALDPAYIAECDSLGRILLDLLGELDMKSRDVILLRFGLEGNDAMTLEEVGQHFGLTRERIRQIESKVLRKLAHPHKRNVLWPFMGDGYSSWQPKDILAK